MVLACVAGPLAAAESGIDSARYQNCMNQTRTDPEAAFESATAWLELGGAEAARHCAAVALIGLGQFAQAAARLQALATDMKSADDATRASILGQAGTAWYRADDYDQAYAAQSAALKLAPTDPELLIDRAMTLAGAKNYWEAIDDLNNVIDRDPERYDAHIMRASAYRYVDSLPLAREDAEAAYRLAPDRPEVLLEYGNVLRLDGKPDQARQMWLRLIQLHDGTPASDSARRNLELLDVKAN
jgi:tetratricopeptide (TPR) repeat protein